MVKWSPQCAIQLSNLTNLQTLGTYSTVSAPPATSVTKVVTFSYDSTLAIIETDQLNPISIFDLTSRSIIKRIPINDSIDEAHFLNQSNQIIIVFGLNSFIVVNLTSGDQYHMNKIDTASIATDWEGNIFTCKNNLISEIKLEIKLGAIPRQEDPFQETISLDNIEKTYEFVNISLNYVLNVTNLLYTFTESQPFAIYFLSFLNYFTVSSLYIF